MAEEHGVLEAEQHRLLQNRDARLRLQSLSWDSAACKEGKKNLLAKECCILALNRLLPTLRAGVF